MNTFDDFDRAWNVLLESGAITRRLEVRAHPLKALIARLPAEGWRLVRAQTQTLALLQALADRESEALPSKKVIRNAIIRMHRWAKRKKMRAWLPVLARHSLEEARHLIDELVRIRTSRLTMSQGALQSVELTMKGLETYRQQALSLSVTGEAEQHDINQWLQRVTIEQVTLGLMKQRITTETEAEKEGLALASQVRGVFDWLREHQKNPEAWNESQKKLKESNWTSLLS